MGRLEEIKKVKIKIRNNKLLKVFKLSCKVLLYSSMIYLLEYHTDLSLFVKGFSMYALIVALKKIKI